MTTPGLFDHPADVVRRLLRQAGTSKAHSTSVNFDTPNGHISYRVTPETKAAIEQARVGVADSDVIGEISA